MKMPTKPLFEKARSLADRLTRAGARQCMFVGGVVRDLLMGMESKDVDLEVYGLGYDQIVSVLGPHHRVDLVGRSFGVVKVDNEIDVNVPRRESRNGVGHRGFLVHPDPTMTPHEAAARRDFTINAMGMLLDGQVFDPFDGQQDLRRGVLRATSHAFREDPLRVLRGMQFAARFGFTMDQPTITLCRSMVPEFRDLAPERVWEEWHKWASKGKFLSRGLQLLRATGWSEHFPVLDQMAETPQDPIWHPEGDVFIHTCCVCDEAVVVADREALSTPEREQLVFAALGHDFGKVRTTTKNAAGRWIAPEHAEASVDLLRDLLEPMRAPARLIDAVVPLVREHMAHVGYPTDEPPPLRAVRRLANRLSPVPIKLWAALCEADHNGRPPRPKSNAVRHWLAAARELGLENQRPRRILMGRHLLPLGYLPGRHLGHILDVAFDAQLEGDIRSIDEGVAWVRNRFPDD